MLDYIATIFRENQVIPIFLTLGLGFWLGNLRFKSFSLGPVTATLLVGVLIGQLDIPISEPVKSVFFMLFLFAIGYSAGPQFFRSLRGEGLKQILFAVVEGAICVLVVVGVCRLMGYNVGTTLGVFAGSQTISAVIGVGSDTLKSLGMPKDRLDYLVGMIPACYAVCYVYGTIGTAWVVANLGPRLLGGIEKVKAETRALEEEMDQGEFAPEPGLIVANRPVSFRAYRVESSFFDSPRRVEEIEEELSRIGVRLFVERLRVKGEIVDPDPDITVQKGDTIVFGGRREAMVNEAEIIGPEVVDHDLLNFAAENLAVTVSRKGADGMTIGRLRHMPYMSRLKWRGLWACQPRMKRRGMRCLRNRLLHRICRSTTASVI